jgi:MFS family permease
MFESAGPGLQPLERQPEPFRHFLWSRFAGQVAQNALLYALLIAIVERTDSSFGSTLLVAAYIVPSILLGIPGGALADALPKRAVLTGVLVLRAAIAAGLLFWADDLTTLYLLVLAFATVGQLFAPAESAAVPALLPVERLARGNAAMSFVLIAAQVIGGVALAPVLLKFAGERAVFVVTAALYLLATWQMLKVRGLQRTSPAAASAAVTRRPGFVPTLAAGWHVIARDRTVFRAVVRLTLVGTVIKIIVAVAPILARNVLQIDAANTVYVMAPAALGAVFGLLLAPPLARLLGGPRLGAVAFVLFSLGAIALSMAERIGGWLSSRPALSFDRIEEITRVPGVVTVVMLIAVVLGLAFSLTTVAVRALINERAPQNVQGRVFATQATIADAASLLPLLAAGWVADHVGVRPVLFAVGALCLLAELSSRRLGPGAEPIPAPETASLRTHL